MTDEQRAQAVDGAMRDPADGLRRHRGRVGGARHSRSSTRSIALYYTGVSFATNDGVKFRQWFALIAWCSLPVVFGMIASFVNLLVSDARFLPQEQLNPLSFGSLLALDSEGATIVERILLPLDVTVLWTTVLQILGYQAFTQRSIVRPPSSCSGRWPSIVLIGVARRADLDRVVMNKKLMLIIGLVVLVVAVPLIQARMRGGGAVEVEVEKLAPRSHPVVGAGVGQARARGRGQALDRGDRQGHGHLRRRRAEGHARRARAADRRSAPPRRRGPATGRPCACRRSRSSASSCKSRTCARNGIACRACTSATSSTRTASTRRRTTSRSPKST